MPNLRLSPLPTALLALTLACAEAPPEPLFDVDGPELRRRYQARTSSTGRAGGGERRAEDPSSPEAIAARGWVGDPDRTPVTSPEFAATDEELWPEELFALELGSQELEVLRLFLLGSLGPERLVRDVLAEDARLVDPAPRLDEPLPVALGVRRSAWRVDSDAPPPLGAEAWPAAVERWRDGWARMRWVRIQPSDVRLEGDRAVVLLRWLANGETAGGGLRHETGTWRTEWVRAEPGATNASSRGWRLELLEPAEGATLESDYAAFVDVTGEALAGTGLDPRRAQPPGGFNRGVALADLDGDGDLDLVSTLPNRVFLNDGNAVFEEAGERLGVAPEDDYYGVLAADFDRDGRLDLVFSGKRKPCLLGLQQEDGTFDCEPLLVSSMNNVPSSLSASDVDGDGWLDLFVCGYGPFFSPGPNDPSNATNGRANQLLRGLPGGEFEDVTRAWGLEDEGTRWAFIGSFGDADEDGDEDLYVAHDFGPNVLFRRLDGDEVRFRAEVEPRSQSDPGFSMSSWWADLDNDLDLDMYVSNMSSIEALRLLKMPGNARDTEASQELRRVMSKGNTMLLQEERDGRRLLLEADSERGGREGAWGWGTAVFDYDLDGDQDIAMVNGFWSQGVDDGRDWDTVWWRHAVKQMQTDHAAWAETFSQFTLNRMHGWSWSGHQRSVFFVNDGDARFVELAPVLGLDQPGDGRALAFGDLDGDGDMDLVGSNYANPEVYVLRNDTRAPGHFALVDPVPRDHVSPAGTRLVLAAGDLRLRRDVQLGGSYLAQHQLAQHFGLADAGRIDWIEVRWPDDTVERFEDLPVDARLVLRQGEPDAKVVELRPRNELATGRLGVEWSEAPRAPFWVDGERPDLGSLELVGAGGAPLTLRGAGTTVLVLWDPGDPALVEEVAGAARLVEAGQRVVLLSVDPREDSALPPGTVPDDARPIAGRLGDESGYAVLRRVLSRWCGQHVYDLPVVLVVDSLGRVEMVQRGALWPDAWLRVL